MNRIARAERAVTKRRTWSWVWRFVIAAIILGFLATITIRATLLDVYHIKSVSMQPTLNPGESILVDLRAYGEQGPERGDIVVFDGRGSFLPYQRASFADTISRALHWSGSNSSYVKRVIGVGGDTVECCSPDGRLMVNGQPIEEEYVMHGNAPSEQKFSVQVPEGRIWVMGDHREKSEDSRSLLGASGGGMIPVGRVLGEVTEVIWPLKKRHPVK